MILDREMAMELHDALQHAPSGSANIEGIRQFVRDCAVNWHGLGMYPSAGKFVDDWFKRDYGWEMNATVDGMDYRVRAIVETGTLVAIKVEDKPASVDVGFGSCRSFPSEHIPVLDAKIRELVKREELAVTEPCHTLARG